jgi:glucan-binding YG repeat protein
LYRKQLKNSKKLHQNNIKNATMSILNEDIEMKIAFALFALLSVNTFAQTTYYNNANGMPLGTAQQSGNTTYYSNANGMPLGTAQQSGNTTYYSNANGMPLGTAQSSQPIQPMQPMQPYSPPSPTFPTSPLFPTSPIGR